jgi:hypothetical protein
VSQAFGEMQAKNRELLGALVAPLAAGGVLYGELVALRGSWPPPSAAVPVVGIAYAFALVALAMHGALVRRGRTGVWSYILAAAALGGIPLLGAMVFALTAGKGDPVAAILLVVVWAWWSAPAVAGAVVFWLVAVKGRAFNRQED